MTASQDDTNLIKELQLDNKTLRASNRDKQHELDNARAAVEALGNEFRREHSRRIQLEDEFSILRGELAMRSAQLRDVKLKTGFSGIVEIINCAGCDGWFSVLEKHECS